jgi:hypothetical protein
MVYEPASPAQEPGIVLNFPIRALPEVPRDDQPPSA